MNKVMYPLLTIILVLSIFIGSGIVTAADSQDWPMFHHDLALSGYTTTKAPDTNAVVWTYDTGSPDIVSSPAVADGRLYIGGLDSKLYALSSRSGELLWTFLAEGPIHSSPAVADGNVYFLDESGKIYALNAVSGAIIWSKIVGNGPWDWSSPAIHGGNVFIASSDGWVHSLNAMTGIINWSTNVGGTPNSMIAVANGKVFTGTHNTSNTLSPTLVAINEANGSIAWSYNYHLFHSGVIGMVNCNGAAVLDGDGDGNLEVYFGVYNWNGVGPQAIALKEADGTEEWAVGIGGNSSSTPAVHNGVVFIGSDDGKVYALNASNSSKKWTYQTGGQVWSSPAVADNKVFVGSLDHTLYALNESDGGLVWSHYTGTSRLYGSPAVAGGRVFIGNENGKVYAFGSRAQDVAPVIGYSPSSFTFTATQGGANPPDDTLNVQNTGSGTLSWSVTDDATWLTLKKTSGRSTGDIDPVTASVIISGLHAGIYNAAITISASGATNNPRIVPVTLVVNPPLFSMPSTGYVGLMYNPVNGKHHGIDIWTRNDENPVNGPGNPVYLPYDGVLTSFIFDGSFGSTGVGQKQGFAFRHDSVPGYGAIDSRYFHMADNDSNLSYINNDLQLGQTYPKGTFLGYQGNRLYDNNHDGVRDSKDGDVITHLHFAIVQSGSNSTIDPSGLLGHDFGYRSSEFGWLSPTP